MAKHTPGPWRVGDAGATVFGPPNGEPAPEVIAHVRRKANARLIASAPDLLAALAKMRCTCCNREEDWPHDEKNEYCHLTLSRAAIAKAKETP